VKIRYAVGAALTALALVGCSSGSDEPSEAATASMLPPVIVTPDQTEVSAKVGDFIVFNVDDPLNNNVTATPAGILEIEQGSDDGMALFNPGAKALAPGTAAVTITDGDSTRTVTVTVE